MLSFRSNPSWVSAKWSVECGRRCGRARTSSDVNVPSDRSGSLGREAEEGSGGGLIARESATKTTSDGTNNRLAKHAHLYTNNENDKSVRNERWYQT